MPLIRRLVGLLLVLISPYGASDFCRAQPYLVPSWLIDKGPSLPVHFWLGLWTICMLCGIGLALGRTSRALLAIPALLIAFLGTVEFTSIYCNYFVLLWLYIVSLLFYREKRCCTRVLIQLSISSCYFYSALEKLHPEWLSGYSVYQIFHNGWCVRPEFIMSISKFNIPLSLASVCSIGIVLLEFFLSFALLFRASRSIALLMGTLLHLFFSIMFAGIDLYTPIVFVGYLAFLGGKTKSPSTQLRWRDPVLASFMIAVILIMPLRFYFTTDWSKIGNLTFGDLSPWGFAMFLQDEKPTWTVVEYFDAKNKIRAVTIDSQRLLLGSNRELSALARHILELYPSAVRAHTVCRIVINSHRTLLKECQAVRRKNAKPFIEIRYKENPDHI